MVSSIAVPQANKGLINRTRCSSATLGLPRHANPVYAPHKGGMALHVLTDVAVRLAGAAG